MGMQHGMDRMAPVFRTANAALKIGAGRLMLHAMHANKAFCACRRRKPPFRRLPLPPPSMPCPELWVLKKTLKAVIKKAKARSGSNLGHARILFARVGIHGRADGQ